MGTSAWLFFILNAFKVPFSAGLGLIHAQTLLFNLMMTPVIILGVLCGRWLTHRLPQRLFDGFLLLFAAAPRCAEVDLGLFVIEPSLAAPIISPRRHAAHHHARGADGMCSPIGRRSLAAGNNRRLRRSPRHRAPAPAAPRARRRIRHRSRDRARRELLDQKPPIVRLDPKEQQKRFQLPPGFTIEPVLTDPLIQDPVGVTFDGNGRMYVLEMRSYMRDADGSNSREPISRISRHEDTNGDGIYDKHTVFADKLVLPRMAFPLQDGVILVLETDNRDLVQLHRYQRRWRRGQERSRLHAIRPRHQHGMAARRHDVGARQLALYDLQPVPAATHARGRRSFAKTRKRQADSGGRRRTTTERCGEWTAAARSDR